MKTISFYRTSRGKCPVKDHFDTLTDVQATKVAWGVELAEKQKKEYLGRRKTDG